MRLTRRNAAAADDARATTTEPEGSNTETLSKSQQRALDRLRIDANDALKGDKVKKEDETGTYWYKGAAYAIDSNTKEEWLTAQPERHLKRKREAEAKHDEVSVPQQETFEESSPAKRKRGRPRKHPLPDSSQLQKDGKSVLGKRKNTTSQQSAQPKRGRPCKNTFRDQDSENDSQSEREDEDDNEAPAITTTRQTRSQVERPIKALKKRRDLVAEVVAEAEAAKQKARDKGLKVDPISEQAQAEGETKRAIMEFMQVRHQVENLMDKYHEASDLHDRIKEHNALAKQLSEEEARNDSPLEDNVRVAPQLEEQAPLTPPDADLDDHNNAPKSYIDKRHDHDYNQEESFVRGEEPTGQSALTVDGAKKSNKTTANAAEPNKTRDVPIVFDRAAIYAGRSSGIYPGDPLPDRDQAGQKLNWSLKVAEDPEGRAEFHIAAYRFPRETDTERSERHHRELLIIAEWEVIDPEAQVYVHKYKDKAPESDRAKVPRKRSREDDDTDPEADRPPRRFPDGEA